MSTIKVDNLQTTGGAGLYPARVWLTYNASASSILGSGNMSSVTDNGVGIYTANFSNSLSDNTYSTQQTADGPVASHHVHGYISAGGSTSGTYSASAVQIAYFRDEYSGNRADPLKSCLVVVR
jgi:hypothetical protein